MQKKLESQVSMAFEKKKGHWTVGGERKLMQEYIRNMLFENFAQKIEPVLVESEGEKTLMLDKKKDMLSFDFENADLVRKGNLEIKLKRMQSYANVRIGGLIKDAVFARIKCEDKDIIRGLYGVSNQPPFTKPPKLFSIQTERVAVWKDSN